MLYWFIDIDVIPPTLSFMWSRQKLTYKLNYASNDWNFGDDIFKHRLRNSQWWILLSFDSKSLMCVPEGWFDNNQAITMIYHDDVFKWKHFPRYWPFVRGIHRPPVNPPHKDQWRGALRRHRAHYDVIVMTPTNGAWVPSGLYTSPCLDVLILEYSEREKHNISMA